MEQRFFNGDEVKEIKTNAIFDFYGNDGDYVILIDRNGNEVFKLRDEIKMHKKGVNWDE